MTLRSACEREVVTELTSIARVTPGKGRIGELRLDNGPSAPLAAVPASGVAPLSKHKQYESNLPSREAYEWVDRSVVG